MSDIALAEIKSKIETSTYEEQVDLLGYIAGLLKNEKPVQNENVLQPKRKLGGLEKGFWIADDFDETPDCFKDYV